jgi:hypothetical protein
MCENSVLKGHGISRDVPSLRDSPLNRYATRHSRAGLQAVPSLRDYLVAARK